MFHLHIRLNWVKDDPWPDLVLGTAFRIYEIGNLMRVRLFFIRVLMALAVLGAGQLVLPGQIIAQAQAATVQNIVINGNQRVENETILSYMQLGVGDSFSDEGIDASIKTLFQTGLFRDVAVDRQGNALVVTVSENPLINVVNFEGNEDIDDDTLLKEVEVRERIIYTKSRISADTKRILSLYQKKGFYNVRVAPKLIRLPENRINLVFEINEGGKTQVEQINFSGNNVFDDGDLQDVIATKVYSKLFFFLRNTTYDSDRLEFDKELLRRHYLKNGFADVEVVSADARLTDDNERFIIDFVVNEGPRYSIADVAINVGDSNLEPESLRRQVKTGVGDTYNAAKVDKSVERLTLEASNQGFVFAKVEPKVDRNPGSATMNLTYEISEGPRTYVERIDIVGNTRTLDEVIRRELRLYEGDAYNRTLIERARRRLTGLDFFEKVDFREEEGSAADKIVLIVEVAEKSTGSVTFSVGYSSVETVVGSVGLQERNLFGRGWDAKLNTSLSFKKQQVDFSFTEPYFMGMPISAGVDLFATRSDNKDASSYTSEQIGGALRTGFKLDEFSSLNLKYLLARRKTDGVDPLTSSPAIISQQGTDWKSAVALTYTYDDLDNPSKPSSGLRAQIETEIAGLGGSTQYAAVEARSWYFVPLLDEKLVVKFELNAGHQQSLGGDDIPLQDRFFKGADSFRGFAKSGIGPKQIGNDGTNDSIGAQTYAIGTLEATFPVGLPEAWGIEGAVFTDFGTVFGTDENSVAAGVGTCNNVAPYTGECSVLDKMGLRASIGAGIVWQSPFGPLRMEAAYPILKQDFDEKELFRFSIGTRF
jgi:outer membrane protein insertion porin family